MPNLSESVEEVKADLCLPDRRVRIIMKSSSDSSVPFIKGDALHLVTKATEILIQILAKESIGNHKTLEYKHVADYVQSKNEFEFLHSIIPKKITGKAFLKLLNEPEEDSEKSENSDESDSSSDSSSDEDESSSSDSSSGKKTDEATTTETAEPTEKKK